VTDIPTATVADLNEEYVAKMESSAKKEFPTSTRCAGKLAAWNRRVNRNRVKINWKFTRKAARRKFGYKRTLSSGHRPKSTISARHRSEEP
jgi:hypothetical protein